MPTDKNIKTPGKLYDHFESYKKYCKDNPKSENFYSQKADKQVSVTREVPYTWDGFEVWLRTEKIIVRLDDYKSNKDDRYSKYADIIHAIDVEIKNDKMNGAFAGIYQHHIIARDLGLRDHRHNEHELPGVNEIKFTYVPPKHKTKAETDDGQEESETE